MDSIGTLASGIAHDFNNILCSILGYVELALKKCTDNKSFDYLTNIQKSAKRASELVNQILLFIINKKYYISFRLKNLFMLV